MTQEHQSPHEILKKALAYRIISFIVILALTTLWFGRDRAVSFSIVNQIVATLVYIVFEAAWQIYE